MISMAVLGRGLIATRARSVAQHAWHRDVILVEDPAKARMVILATSEAAASEFLNSPDGKPNGRLIYDLSGYSKRSPGYSYTLDAAFFGAEIKEREGVFAVPACYASSVLIPLAYLLRYGFVTSPLDVQAVCVGGRTTLGASGKIGNGVLRLASAASTSLHSRECAQHLPEDVRCLFTILVGDLRSGIVTTGTILPASGDPCLRLAVSLDPATLRLRRDEWPGIGLEVPFNNDCQSHLRFVVAGDQDDGNLRLLSYVHNLDLPLSVVYAHARAALEDEWAAIPAVNDTVHVLS